MHHKLELKLDNTNLQLSLDIITRAFLLFMGDTGIRYTSFSKTTKYVTDACFLYPYKLINTGTSLSIEFEDEDSRSENSKYFKEFLEEDYIQKRFNIYLANYPKS